MRNKSFIETQKITRVPGNSGSYEKWVDKYGSKKSKGTLGDRFDFVSEDPRANPDCLREDAAVYVRRQMSIAQELMGTAIEHLQGRQKQVYLLTMREGLSIAKAAYRLDITKNTARVYRDRAIKFITSYCQGVMNNDSF